jgi:hypothetical protein
MINPIRRFHAIASMSMKSPDFWIKTPANKLFFQYKDICAAFH